MKLQKTFFSCLILSLLLFSACAKESPSPQSGGMTPVPVDEQEGDQLSSSTMEPTIPPSKDASPAQFTEQLPESQSDAESKTYLTYRNPLTSEQQAEGWLSLFDGETLFGWESTSEEINWQVQQGAIVADSGPIGVLLTTLPFVDYELVCEYRMEQGGNSGLFLRTSNPPGDISTECYEVNIADEHPDGYTTGSLVNRQKVEMPVERREEWNEIRVTVNGPLAEVAHNGKVVVSYTSENNIATTGRIGLQKNAGKIEFRKVIVKPLNLKSLFNGNDLAGWREVPGSKSEFTVADQQIHLKNGQGFIETEESFQNFLFQAQAISHADELNSGFFFRAMPGTEEAPSNGYEYQIHNGYKEHRSLPNNAGTGAIFRRIDARYVVANDKEWFTATLIAHGPRIGCWVDGYHVVDWVDDRKPDPNPRKGLRLEGGHISLQGHDPTTDLSFKNLRIAEYPAAVSSKE